MPEHGVTLQINTAQQTEMYIIVLSVARDHDIAEA
jgi:hypothetical protein